MYGHQGGEFDIGTKEKSVIVLQCCSVEELNDWSACLKKTCQFPDSNNTKVYE